MLARAYFYTAKETYTVYFFISYDTIAIEATSFSKTT